MWTEAFTLNPLDTSWFLAPHSSKDIAATGWTVGAHFMSSLFSGTRLGASTTVGGIARKAREKEVGDFESCGRCGLASVGLADDTFCFPQGQYWQGSDSPSLQSFRSTRKKENKSQTKRAKKWWIGSVLCVRECPPLHDTASG